MIELGVLFINTVIGVGVFGGRSRGVGEPDFMIDVAHVAVEERQSILIGRSVIEDQHRHRRAAHAVAARASGAIRSHSVAILGKSRRCSIHLLQDFTPILSIHSNIIPHYFNIITES